MWAITNRQWDKEALEQWRLTMYVPPPEAMADQHTKEAEGDSFMQFMADVQGQEGVSTA